MRLLVSQTSNNEITQVVDRTERPSDLIEPSGITGSFLTNLLRVLNSLLRRNRKPKAAL